MDTLKQAIGGNFFIDTQLIKDTLYINYTTTYDNYLQHTKAPNPMSESEYKWYTSSGSMETKVIMSSLFLVQNKAKKYVCKFGGLMCEIDNETLVNIINQHKSESIEHYDFWVWSRAARVAFNGYIKNI